VSGQVTHLQFQIDAVLEQFKATQWFELYWNALSEENKKVNLVSRETQFEGFKRMVAEALFPFTQLNRRFASYLDIGSGGGLPAVPVLMGSISSGPTTLFERTKKKAAALGRVVEALRLPNVRIVAESFGEKPVAGRFSLVTLSYVTLTPELLVSICSTLQPDGRCVYYSKPAFSQGKCRVQVFSYSQSGSDIHKYFTVFSK
jgi:16S rRNA G527 N7-methylase RsmG